MILKPELWCVAATDANTCGQCGAETGLLILNHMQHKGSSVCHSFTEVCRIPTAVDEEIDTLSAFNHCVNTAAQMKRTAAYVFGNE